MAIALCGAKERRAAPMRPIDPSAKVALAFEDSPYRSQVDLDASYMLAFDFSCDAFNLSKMKSIDANPSYVQATEMIRSIEKGSPLQLLNVE